MWSRIKFTVFLATLTIVVGCRLPASATEQATQAEPKLVFTAAAQTAEALRLQGDQENPAPARLIPTITQAPLIPTATLPLTVTRIVPTGTLLATTMTPPVGDDRAEFIADVTVPDGTMFQPGESFVKTWKLQNIGSTTWTSEYSAVFLDGDLLDGPLSINLPNNVESGKTIDISIDFTAPMEAGDYRGYWKLKSPNGDLFGVGIDSVEAFWVDILVSSTSATGDANPTAMSDKALAGLTLGVDNAIYSGVCPHTYRFTAQVLLNKPATIAYYLEADNNAGLQVKLPPPATRNLEAGTHTIIFDLTFAQTLTGWIRLQVTAPESIVSNRVNIELECQ